MLSPAHEEFIVKIVSRLAATEREGVLRRIKSEIADIDPVTDEQLIKAIQYALDPDTTSRAVKIRPWHTAKEAYELYRRRINACDPPPTAEEEAAWDQVRMAMSEKTAAELYRRRLLGLDMGAEERAERERERAEEDAWKSLPPQQQAEVRAASERSDKEAVDLYRRMIGSTPLGTRQRLSRRLG